MELKDAIMKRRSIKKYLDIAVEQEKLADMIEAATMAPSAGNIQPWAFIIVQDKQKREAIARCCLEQLWMVHAPVFIVVCAETKRMKEFYGDKGATCYSRESCAAAIENMLLTATDLGLGTCWVGAFNERIAKRELSIPDDVSTIAIITVGYPDEDPKMPERKRLDAICNFGKWGTKTTDMALWKGRYGDVLQEKIAKAKEALKDRFRR